MIRPRGAERNRPAGWYGRIHRARADAVAAGRALASQLQPRTFRFRVQSSLPRADQETAMNRLSLVTLSLLAFAATAAADDTSSRSVVAKLSRQK